MKKREKIIEKYLKKVNLSWFFSQKVDVFKAWRWLKTLIFWTILLIKEAILSIATINRHFPFSRVKIAGQRISEDCSLAIIKVVRDLRYTSHCGRCGKPLVGYHSQTTREIRDLNIATAKIFIHARYRQGFCLTCGICVEYQQYVFPGKRLTKRLARYVADLYKLMSVKEVAEHLGLNWKTVKAIDKQTLQETFGETDYQGIRILAVDEIAVRRGHRYLTVVLDYDRGRVV